MRLAGPETTLLLHGRDRAALSESCHAVEQLGARVQPLLFDLALGRGVDDLLAAVGDVPIDLLVNNAGFAVVKPFAEISQAEWQQTLAVNVTAPFRLIQHFGPRLRPGASIVNILSIAAKTSFPNWSAYCASKFALEGLTGAIREELRKNRVRVLNVYPASTATEIWDNVAGEWPRDRMMRADDIARAVVFAVEQPPELAIENITLGHTAGPF